MLRKWEIGNEQQRRQCIDEVITRLQEQEGTEFGHIIAEDIIDIVAQNIGPHIYKSGVNDAQKVVSDKLADLDVDLDLLGRTD